MRVIVILVGAGLLWFFGTALFERFAPRHLVRRYQRFANPGFSLVAGFVPGWAVIETIGARSGRPRHTPVGGRFRRGQYWFVAGDWRHSQFVRNIEAHPRVRVRVHGRWHGGTARVLESDDARRRLLLLNPVNSLFVWIAAKDPVTIRIDLD